MSVLLPEPPTLSPATPHAPTPPPSPTQALPTALEANPRAALLPVAASPPPPVAASVTPPPATEPKIVIVPMPQQDHGLGFGAIPSPFGSVRWLSFSGVAILVLYAIGRAYNLGYETVLGLKDYPTEHSFWNVV